MKIERDKSLEGRRKFVLGGSTTKGTASNATSKSAASSNKSTSTGARGPTGPSGQARSSPAGNAGGAPGASSRTSNAGGNMGAGGGGGNNNSGGPRSGLSGSVSPTNGSKTNGGPGPSMGGGNGGGGRGDLGVAGVPGGVNRTGGNLASPSKAPSAGTNRGDLGVAGVPGGINRTGSPLASAGPRGPVSPMGGQGTSFSTPQAARTFNNQVAGNTFVGNNPSGSFPTPGQVRQDAVNRANGTTPATPRSYDPLSSVQAPRQPTQQPQQAYNPLSSVQAPGQPVRPQAAPQGALGTAQPGGLYQADLNKTFAQNWADNTLTGQVTKAAVNAAFGATPSSVPSLGPAGPFGAPSYTGTYNPENNTFGLANKPNVNTPANPNAPGYFGNPSAPVQGPKSPMADYNSAAVAQKMQDYQRQKQAVTGAINRGAAIAQDPAIRGLNEQAQKNYQTVVGPGGNVSRVYSDPDVPRGPTLGDQVAGAWNATTDAIGGWFTDPDQTPNQKLEKDVQAVGSWFNGTMNPQVPGGIDPLSQAMAPYATGSIAMQNAIAQSTPSLSLDQQRAIENAVIGAGLGEAVKPISQMSPLASYSPTPPVSSPPGPKQITDRVPVDAYIDRGVAGVPGGLTARGVKTFDTQVAAAAPPAMGNPFRNFGSAAYRDQIDTIAGAMPQGAGPTFSAPDGPLQINIPGGPAPSTPKTAATPQDRLEVVGGLGIAPFASQESEYVTDVTQASPSMRSRMYGEVTPASDYPGADGITDQDIGGIFDQGPAAETPLSDRWADTPYGEPGDVQYPEPTRVEQLARKLPYAGPFLKAARFVGEAEWNRMTTEERIALMDKWDRQNAAYIRGESTGGGQRGSNTDLQDQLFGNAGGSGGGYAPPTDAPTDPAPDVIPPATVISPLARQYLGPTDPYSYGFGNEYTYYDYG